MEFLRKLQQVVDAVQKGGPSRYTPPADATQFATVQVLQSQPHSKIIKGTKLRIILEGDELVLVKTGLTIDEEPFWRGVRSSVLSKTISVPRAQLPGSDRISSLDIGYNEQLHGQQNAAIVTAAEHIARQNRGPEMQPALSLVFVDLAGSSHLFSIVVLPTVTGALKFQSTIEFFEDLDIENRRSITKNATTAQASKLAELEELKSKQKDIAARQDQLNKRLEEKLKEQTVVRNRVLLWVISKTEEVVRKHTAGEISDADLQRLKRTIYNKASGQESPDRGGANADEIG